MANPVGMNEALAVYRAAASAIESKSAGKTESAGAAAPSSFGSLLKAELDQAKGAVAESEKASLQAMTGQASVQEVVEAVSAAELGLQKVTAVRDRVISAYQEIIRMPI